MHVRSSRPAELTEAQQPRESHFSRIFLRLYAWRMATRLSDRDAAYSAWDSALWTLSLFVTLLVLAAVAAVATIVGLYLGYPHYQLSKLSRPDSRVALSVFAPALAIVYFFLRTLFRDFRQKPEAAERFNTKGDRIKLLMLPVCFTLAFLGLEGLCGYLLR